MWWEVRGKLDGKVVRYRVEAINQTVAETLAHWKGIEVLAVIAEQIEPGPMTKDTLLDAFGPFVGDVPPTLAE